MVAGRAWQRSMQEVRSGKARRPGFLPYLRELFGGFGWRWSAPLLVEINGEEFDIASEEFKHRLREALRHKVRAAAAKRRKDCSGLEKVRIQHMEVAKFLEGAYQRAQYEATILQTIIEGGL